MDRRSVLAGFAASAALAFTRWPARAIASAPHSPEGLRLVAILDQIYQALINLDPEFATTLGVDTGDRKSARSRLADRSVAGVQKYQDFYRQSLAKIKSITPARLQPAELVDYETFVGPWTNMVNAFDTFSYGTSSWPEPYIVSQLSGCYRQLPDFLVTQHPIQSADDAEAYLARCADFSHQLDHETVRLKSDHADGIIAPDFVIDGALTMLAAVMKPLPQDHRLVTNLAEKAASFPGDWAKRCQVIIATQIYPALNRQAEALRKIRPQATANAGIWGLPKGDAYYAYALRYATTTDLSADAIHKMGLEQMAELTARADGILRAQGRTSGTVGQRLDALGREERFLYANNDEGKARLIADLNKQVVAIRARLPEVFGRMPKSAVEVRRIPADIESGAPGGYYDMPSLDGTRPGAYYINLRDTAENPSWSLPTLTYHEALPGHHHQIALSLEAEDTPALRRLPAYSVFSEGWGLYAERLADEMGMYADDPFGQLGYLQSFMFRAARLVVDTGLHHYRWSRERAIQYMNDALGTTESSNRTEVDRYCVWPGQATSYMVGQLRWVAIREKARAALGDAFDIRGFHDVALAAGTVPMDVLEKIIDRWVAAQKP